MRKLITLTLAIVSIIAVALVGVWPAQATETDSRGQGHSLVFNHHAHPYGQSLATWTERWWQWTMGVPFAHNPSVDPIGADCGVGQPGGHVWYLGTTFNSASATRSCSVPKGQAILVNLSGTLNDYPCPFPGFEPAPGQTLEDFLAAGAKGAADRIDGLTLTIDGVEISGLFDYRAATRLFTFTGDPTMRAIDSCVTGTAQAAVADGYMIVVKPLSKGVHSLVTTGHSIGGTSLTVSYTITVT